MRRYNYLLFYFLPFSNYSNGTHMQLRECWQNLQSTVYGERCMVYGVRCTVLGVWSVECSPLSLYATIKATTRTATTFCGCTDRWQHCRNGLNTRKIGWTRGSRGSNGRHQIEVQVADRPKFAWLLAIALLPCPPHSDRSCTSASLIALSVTS